MMWSSTLWPFLILLALCTNNRSFLRLSSALRKYLNKILPASYSCKVLLIFRCVGSSHLFKMCSYPSNIKTRLILRIVLARIALTTKMWQESRDSRNHQLWYMPVTARIDERNTSETSNSGKSIGSCVEDDPAPLPFPYHVGEYNFTYEYEQHQNPTHSQNSSNENNIDPRSHSTVMMSQESWVSQNSPPYCKPTMERICKRNNSRTSNSGISNCAWTKEDPTPLPYHVGADDDTNEHIFSTDDCQQLTLALGLDGEPQGKSGSPCLHQATDEQILAEIEKRLSAKEGAKIKKDDSDYADFKHFWTQSPFLEHGTNIGGGH
mmetsp:Transcript_35431/g.65560  ORF Transcript_35431/g.65560 Transcript_35431/m.65560 type:complete len:321 (-) Transcript_35431:392-1354(-)